MSAKLRIAIVVHGRFHGFDLARALLARGEGVRVFTNYPRFVVARFGVAPDTVTNCVWHGVVSRVAARFVGTAKGPRLEAWTHRSFSRWASKRVVASEFDVVHCFSGIAEELWRGLRKPGPLRSLVRGSAHIDAQFQILDEEARRQGRPIEMPSVWRRGREVREYQLSDQIVVLSQFALRSFLEHGVPAEKLALVALGSDVRRFAATPELVAARRARVASGAPLRILTVGTWTLRKGVTDLMAIARELSPQFQFRFVGAIAEDARHTLAEAQKWIEFRPRVFQHELPNEYAWGDLFLFPTLEDGFAVVLAQAQAAGLPILATGNCAAPDLIAEGQTGWTLPIRDVGNFVNRLRWCSGQRVEFNQVVARCGQNPSVQDWPAVAAEFCQVCRTQIRGLSGA